MSRNETAKRNAFYLRRLAITIRDTLSELRDTDAALTLEGWQRTVEQWANEQERANLVAIDE